MVIVDGQRYYYLLKDKDETSKSLMSYYQNKRDELNSGIVICRNFPPRPKYREVNPKELRLFAFFKDHITLYKHMLQIEQSRRSFFEVIFGNRPQKPHFDIDVCDNAGTPEEVDKLGNQILENVISCLLECLKSVNVTLNLNKDLLIYTSTQSVGTDNKISYHIIVNSWVHQNNLEAENLATMVRSLMKEEYKSYLDSSVYSSTQQFRILGCNKINSTRIKRPVLSVENHAIIYPKFEYPTDELLASLVSNSVGCSILPIFINASEAITINSDGSIVNSCSSQSKARCQSSNERKLNRDDMTLMLELLSQSMGYAKNSIGIKSIFSIREANGGIVSLTKKQSYRCIICQRKHDNENPFLSISGNGNVRYHCRRAEDSRYIGILDHLCITENEGISSTPPDETDVPITPGTPGDIDIIFSKCKSKPSFFQDEAPKATLPTPYYNMHDFQPITPVHDANLFIL